MKKLLTPAAVRMLIAAAFVLLPVALKAETADAEKSIVETAVSAGNCNTFIAAVKLAGLVELLNAEGPLSVFAPTDEAFAKLPAGTVESLLLPENREKLVDMLKQHIVAGSFPATKLLQSDSLKSMQGNRLPIKQIDEAVLLDKAQLVSTDMMCSNGILHTVDKVLLLAQ